MTSPAVTVAPEDRVKDVAALLVEHKIGAVPVVTAGGRLAGIVSEADLGELLEEQAGLLLPFQVAVRNGVVTLTGPADQDSRNLAKLLARTVAGVIAVRFADLPAETAREHHTAHRA